MGENKSFPLESSTSEGSSSLVFSMTSSFCVCSSDGPPPAVGSARSQTQFESERAVP